MFNYDSLSPKRNDISPGVRLTTKPREISQTVFYRQQSGSAPGGIRSIKPGHEDLRRGALFETFVGQNLAAPLEAHLPDAQLTYWQEQGRHEDDFIIEMGRRVCAIEVKAATRWSNNDLSGLRAFIDRTPSCIAAVLAYYAKESAKLGDKLRAIPMGKLLE